MIANTLPQDNVSNHLVPNPGICQTDQHRPPYDFKEAQRAHPDSSRPTCKKSSGNRRLGANAAQPLKCRIEYV